MHWNHDEYESHSILFVILSVTLVLALLCLLQERRESVFECQRNCARINCDRCRAKDVGIGNEKCNIPPGSNITINHLISMKLENEIKLKFQEIITKLQHQKNDLLLYFVCRLVFSMKCVYKKWSAVFSESVPSKTVFWFEYANLCSTRITLKESLQSFVK